MTGQFRFNQGILSVSIWQVSVALRKNAKTFNLASVCMLPALKLSARTRITFLKKFVLSEMELRALLQFIVPELVRCFDPFVRRGNRIVRGEYVEQVRESLTVEASSINCGRGNYPENRC